MGLLLFWGIPGEPPVIIVTDGGIKPQILFVERTGAITDITQTTYNDSLVTYSSSLQTYGGADRVQSAPANLNFVKPDMSHLSFLKKTIATADQTSTVYNDTNTVYSSSTQTYGGSDRIVDPAPQIMRVGS